MTTPSRRAFLKTATLATAATMLSARSWAQVAGAGSDVRVAVVGLNGRGRNHLASLRAEPLEEALISSEDPLRPLAAGPERGIPRDVNKQIRADRRCSAISS